MTPLLMSIFDQYLPNSIWVDIPFIIIGIWIVLTAANKLTDGSVSLARRMNIPQIVIGLTIVAMGTSMPEFFVSFVSALHGTPDLAVGNVVGSNIFNEMLIVGLSAVVAPITILKTTVRKDIPFGLLATLVLVLLSYDRQISRIDAGILLILFFFFMASTLYSAKKEKTQESDNSAIFSIPRSLIYVVLGLVGLILGSNVFVDRASHLAQSLGVSEAIIGLTIVAMGTSLPELATSIVAARKGNSGIAIGNVLGSNVFNILFILGTTGFIAPMTISGITNIDLGMMLLGMVLLWIMSFTKLTIQRWEGAVMTVLFTAYLSYLIYQAVGM